MEKTAEVALRALDSHLADGRWSAVVSPPEGSRPGTTFQWADIKRGINATAVTVPDDWIDGTPVLIRLQRTPVAPRLPAPSLGAPPKASPMRSPFGDLHQSPLVGVAATRPVKFSEDWKAIFKTAGVRKSDLSDPVKAMRIALALAESWDVNAKLPEMPGFTDKLGPLASLSLGPSPSEAAEEAEWDLGMEAAPPQPPQPANQSQPGSPADPTAAGGEGGSTRTQSGRFAPQSDRSGRDAQGTQVGVPGVRQLRKPKARAEAPREKTELELVRERMAKKMQERLRELEEQDVAESWEDDAAETQGGLEDSVAAQPPSASAEQPPKPLQRKQTRSLSDREIGGLEYV